eukprot:m51a1_g11740 putative dna-directed rna polymerase (217) ;mRNA; r:149361-150312
MADPLDIGSSMTLIEDTVKVAPGDFGNFERCVVRELDRKYANRVIYDVGLGVSVYDVLSMRNALVYSSEPACHVHATFRLVVFRPPVGAVLAGTVKRAWASGLQISLGFFDDCIISSANMPKPSLFSDVEKLWYWNYNDNQLWMEIGQEIRFRVEDVIFQAPKSQPKPVTPSAGDGDAEPEAPAPQLAYDAESLPMVVLGLMEEPGLGMVSWWQDQ